MEDDSDRLGGCVVFFILGAILCVVVAAFWGSVDAIPPEPLDQQAESAHDEMVGSARSDEWPKVRLAHLRKNPYCEACGTVLELNVHHIKPFHTNPELELDPRNLITLCREHHFFVGHDPDGPWGSQKPDWKASNPRVRADARRLRQMVR